MKRSELIRYLHAQDCELLREGGRHSWWYNATQNKCSASHNEQRYFSK